MIDLGTADQQREIVGGPIPNKSLVKVKVEIRQPKNADPNDEAVTVFSSGLKGLDFEFTVTDGQYKGVRIWENWFFKPEMQNISLTKGQEGICRSGFAKCRAAIEAVRRIDPDDPAANRNIQSWFDLHGIEIPVRVGMDKPKAGDQYINNKIDKVLTVKDADFETVIAGGEVISDEPIPDLPERKEKKTGGDSPKSWGQIPQGKDQGSGKKEPEPTWSGKGNRR